MAKNKILVQIIDHENGNSVLGQDYFESREKAESPLRSLSASTNHHFL